MILPKHRKEIFWLFVYILWLYITWTVCRLLLIPPLQQAIGSPWNMLVEAVSKFLLWVVPVLVYIKYVLKADVLSYLKLKTLIGKGILWGLLGCLIPLVIFCSNVFIHHKPLHLSLSPSVWLNVVLLVGLIEEIPFRGLIFQQMQVWWGFWKASLFSSFLFVTIHLPLWIVNGQTSVAVMVSQSISVFVLGLLFSYLFKRSHSLWSCILMHSIYDFVGSIF
jgi:membrane protease YdiL (CAAX protease family)